MTLHVRALGRLSKARLTLLCLALALPFAISPDPAHASEAHFCWGTVLKAKASGYGGEDICSGAAYNHLNAIYGTGEQHSVCVLGWINKTVQCSGGAGEGVYNNVFGGNFDVPEITNNGYSDNKVYGLAYYTPVEPPPPPPPHSWHWESLGGSVTSSPAIAAESYNHMDMVARGSDGALYYRSWSSTSGWGGWGPVAGGTGSVTSSPDAVSWGEKRLDIVARLSDNTVEHWWWDGSTWHSENLGGSITSDPAIASEGLGKLEVVARGTDNALYYRAWTSELGWSSWLQVASGTGPVTSGPDAVGSGGGRLDIVARAPDNSVWHWWWDGGSWHWEGLGGSVTTDPAIASDWPNTLQVVARGTDNALYYRASNTESAWGSWTAVGSGTGPVNSAPDAVGTYTGVWGQNRLDIVAQSPEASVWHWWWGE